MLNGAMSSRGRPKHPDILTPREWEVLGHVREGRSNEQIAERLGISTAGVKYHVSEILGKLALDNRHDAARWADGQSPRPWPAGALAPLLFWRKLKFGWLSPVIAGGLLVAVAAGLGLLIWGLLATRGDDESATAPVIPATTAMQVLDRPSPNFGAVDFVSDEEGWMTAGGGLLHSTDGGATWEEIARVTGNDIDFADAMHGWLVGGSGAIFRSEDGGQSWSEQDSGTDIHLKDIEAIDTNEAWVVGSGEGSGDEIAYPSPTVLLHTTDGGATWEQVETPAGVWLSEVAFIEEKGWAIGSCSCGDGISGAVFSTRDGGRSWNLLDTELPAWLSELSFTDEQHGWVMGRCISIASCLEGPYTTSDGGRTWALKAAPGYTSYRLLAFRDADTGWVIATEDRDECPCERFVLETADGGDTWRRQSTLAVQRGPLVSNLWTFGERVFITGQGTSLRSTNGAASFEVMRTPAVALGDIEFISPDVGFTVTRNAFMKTDDGGITWKAVGELAGGRFRLDFIDATQGFVTADEVLHRTVDGGQSWERIFPEEGDDSGFGFVRDIQFPDAKRGWLVTEQAMYRTDDGGEHWEEQLLSGVRRIQSLKVIDADTAWVVVDVEEEVFAPARRMFRTTDGGRTWNFIRNLTVYEGVIVDAASADVAWFTTIYCFPQPCNSSVFRTTDGGETWSEFAPGDVLVRDMAFADEQNGWVSSRFCRDSCENRLLRTEDGGATWQDVQLAESVWGNLVILDADTGWLQPLSGSAFTLTTIDGRTLLYQLR